MSYSFPLPNEWLTYAAAAISILLGAFVAVKDSRSFANRCFTAILVLLGLMEIAGGLSAAAESSQQMEQWHTIWCVLLSITPGIGILFSLSFARQEYKKFLKDWKFIIVAAFACPLGIILSPLNVFESFLPEYKYIQLGDAGKIFYTIIVIVAVLILASLEKTLRASIGRIRWQIKFIFLGMSIVCLDWVYTGSQAILYGRFYTSDFLIHPAALLCADILFIWGLIRSQFLKVDIYLSRSTIQYSLTALFVSLYLVVLGLLAYGKLPLPGLSLLIVLALASLGMLLLSDRLQERLRRFITHNFKRPLYDYRNIWMELTGKTSACVTTEDLCAEVSRIISKTFGILSVNIWICDETLQRLSLAGSTVFAKAMTQDLEREGDNVSALLNAVENSIVDLKEKNFAWADDIMASHPGYFDEFKMRYIVPLRNGGVLVGLITLNEDRVGKAPLSIEDKDLLYAYGAQLAAGLLQMRLSENLRKVQEIEAFHNVTTFFVHDLKNLASRLSLTMQNLPTYFDNPEFREDALKLIGESVAKIESTCSRLSSLKRKIELNPEKVDFNFWVQSVVEDFNRATQYPIDLKFENIPPLWLDREQMGKVFTNLIINAHEAMDGEGTIRIATCLKDHKAIFSISDDGCGMSRQFVEKDLFRPFHSTKKKGMGIGLFQSRMIVEAHRGAIEVDSEEGKGSTFRVILPIIND